MDVGVLGDRYEELSECPYCFSEDLSVLFSAPDRFTHSEGEYFVSSCNECGLWFQNPRIKEEIIGEYYTDDLGYYTPTTESSAPKHPVKRYLYDATLANHFLVPDIAPQNMLLRLVTFPFVRDRKIELEPTFVNSGRLLEIGCSHGAKLAEWAKEGWDVVGVELDQSAAEYARDTRGLMVHDGRIEEQEFDDEQFDVIVLNMVVEHLYDPFEKMRLMSRWLKPGGQFIFSVPVSSGLEIRLFRSYAYLLHLPAHITFMNSGIIKRFLRDEGFSGVSSYHHRFDRDFVASAGNFADETNRPWLRALVHNSLVRKGVIRPFVALLSLAGRTSRVTIHSIKKH